MKTSYIRTGDCNRCGKCCTPFNILSTSIQEEIKNEDKEAYIILKNTTCPNLEFTFEGLSGCRIHENKSEACKKFPSCPQDTENIKECSYRFIEVKV
jgi:hypothetical protein